MPDGFSILTFLSGIKNAKETLNLIIDAPKILEKTELQYKIASLTKTLTELENQARDFEKIVQDKDREIERLKSQVIKIALPQPEILPDECISILKILSEGLNPPIPESIASCLKMSIQRIKYFLDILKDNNLVDITGNIRVREVYQLNEKGRQLLFNKGLL